MDVHEEDLVLVVIDDAAEAGTELDERAMRELGAEYRQLHVLAVSLHEPKHVAQAFGVADVVRDDECLAHGRSQRVRKAGYASISPRRERPSCGVWTSTLRR